MAPIGISPLGTLSDERVDAFLARCVATYPADGMRSRRVEGLRPFVHYCAGSPFDGDGVTRLADIIPNTAGAHYRACLEHDAERAAYEVEAISRRLLKDELLDVATRCYVDMVEVDAWPSGDGVVLKGALLLPCGLQPVEITRACNPIRADRERLVRSFITRLLQSRHRQDVLLSTNISFDFVDAMLQTVSDLRVVWLGRVSEYQSFRRLDIEWKQPAQAHVQDVFEAVRYDAQRRGGVGGFAYAELRRIDGADAPQRPQARLLVAYGPSPGAGRFYLHTPPQHAAALKLSRAQIEDELADCVAKLECDEPTLAGFKAERLYCKPANAHQYALITRRIMFAWQYALMGPDPDPSSTKLPKKDAA